MEYNGLWCAMDYGDGSMVLLTSTKSGLVPPNILDSGD